MKLRFLLTILALIVVGGVHADQPGIEVFKLDGTLQCGMGSEFLLDEMAAELRAAGVVVLASRKGTDGLMRAAVCSAQTGGINLYRIAADQLEAATGLGFRRLEPAKAAP